MVLLACMLSFVLCFVLVPPVIGVSWRIGAVDVPADWRRMHCVSIPRGGGIAIFLAFLISVCAMGVPNRFLACVLAGGGLLLTVGLADDIFCLGAGVKLFYQSVIAMAVVLGSGIVGGWSAVLAVLWVVTLTNAHNFIDGLDGLFAGCAAIEGGALCLIYALMGVTQNAVPPLLLSLSCLAFRYYNRYPASIFAGDCGSGTVGFLLGILSLPLFLEQTIGMQMAAPFLIFAYPITDLFTSVLRRLLRGKSPFSADRGHLHHRITAAGLTHPQCGGVLLCISAALSAVGVLIGVGGDPLPASLACLATVFLLMRIRRYILDFS